MNDDSEMQLWRRYCWEFLSGFYCAWTYSVSLRSGVGKSKWNVDQAIYKQNTSYPRETAKIR
jgi:hypothetical protein